MGELLEDAARLLPSQEPAAPRGRTEIVRGARRTGAG